VASRASVVKGYPLVCPESGNTADLTCQGWSRILNVHHHI
jgi:hypothetical protein